MQEIKPELSTKKLNEHSQVDCAKHQVSMLYSHAEGTILRRIFKIKKEKKTNDSLIVKVTFSGGVEQQRMQENIIPDQRC
jgi:hypothetical protein